MHRRPTLTQRHGLFTATRYVLYGNRVRVIRLSPLVRDDRYIPLTDVDPDGRTVRRPEPRLLLLAVALAVPGVLGALGWPRALPDGAATAAIGFSLLALVSIGGRGWPGRTWVHHGALVLLAEDPDASRFRAFMGHVIAAARETLASTQEQPTPARGASIAQEIRRLHAHCHAGSLRSEAFARHKLRLIRGLREPLP